MRPGSEPIDVPVEVKGDTRFSYARAYDVLAKAVRGAVIGSYRGGVTVKDDDPMPTVSLTPVPNRATEGEPDLADHPVRGRRRGDLDPLRVRPVTTAPNCPPRTSTRSGWRDHR